MNGGESYKSNISMVDIETKQKTDQVNESIPLRYEIYYDKKYLSYLHIDEVEIYLEN